MPTQLRFLRLVSRARLAPAVALLLATGCSSGSFEVAGATDASSDAGADAAPDARDTGPEAAPPLDGGTFECADPSHCGPLKPHCCATFDLGPGTQPQCPMLNVDTKCQAACGTQIPLSCPSSGRVKVCRDSSDCLAEAAYPKCCKIFAGGVIGSVCVNQLIANATAASCN